MRYVTLLAILSSLTVLAPVSALARATNKRSVDILDPVQIGATQLKPGNYTLEWQEAGPAAQVRFMRRGKTVATAPATLKSNDSQVKQDDVIFQTTSSNQKQLREIDFQHRKESLIFARR